MSYYNDFGAGALDRLKTEYDVQRIQNLITRGEEVQDMIVGYALACYNRIAEIKKTEFRWHVELTKTKDYITGKVEYRVSAQNVPQVPNGKQYAVIPSNGSRRFEGNDTRQEAISMAKDLADSYDCKIQLNKTFNLTKKEQALLAGRME